MCETNLSNPLFIYVTELKFLIKAKAQINHIQSFEPLIVFILWPYCDDPNDPKIIQ